MITLYRIEPKENMHRFYHLRVERTLFGEWALIREWGRIGTPRGQSLEQWFDDPDTAINVMRKLETAKRNRGYAERVEKPKPADSSRHTARQHCRNPPP